MPDMITCPVCGDEITETDDSVAISDDWGATLIVHGGCESDA